MRGAAGDPFSPARWRPRHARTLIVFTPLRGRGRRPRWFFVRPFFITPASSPPSPARTTAPSRPSPATRLPVSAIKEREGGAVFIKQP